MTHDSFIYSQISFLLSHELSVGTGSESRHIAARACLHIKKRKERHKAVLNWRGVSPLSTLLPGNTIVDSGVPERS